MEPAVAASSDMVVVKNEIDHDAYTYIITSASYTNGEIKHEPPLDLKDEPATEDLTQGSTTAESAFDVAGEYDASSNECEFKAQDPGLVENFVSYDFDSAANELTSQISAVQPIAHSAPTLLNESFRKRSKSNNTTTVTAAVKTSTENGMPTVTPATKVLSELAKSTVVSATKMTTEINTPTVASTAKLTTELKVKCLCRLGGITNQSVALVNKGPELKEFFEQMFENTRQLRREQQRTVQMALLEAVCQAEADVEAGKCCANCCSQL